ncbi:hypothetical protein G7085_20635 [Tessaracoccus sp. HDW20]|nr:hypothetical protein [Tessaracoccus coleopterorum]
MLTRSSLPPLLMLVLSAATGLLLGAGQAPMGVWPATIAGVGLFAWLMLGLRGRAAFGWGYLVGLVHNALTISWVSVLGVWVGVALVAFMALWWGLLGLLVARLMRLRAWPCWCPQRGSPSSTAPGRSRSADSRGPGLPTPPSTSP